MKRIAVLTCSIMVVGAPVLAQESETTYQTTTTTTLASKADLVRELWFIDDARTIDPGSVDLRMTFRWITANAPANLGDSDDDFIVVPGLAWGPCDNVEVFADVPVWVGDSGDKPGVKDGNADTNLGFTWRFWEGKDTWNSALAFRGTARIPTGDDSDGVDGEFRLILTNEYESDLRSHINVFGQTVNGDVDPGLRDFQWGFLAGMDGPLCMQGAVRWVADYLHRSSYHDGASNINLMELGWEWDMAEAQKLGMSVQVGLDRTGDTPNVGAAIAYSHSLLY